MSPDHNNAQNQRPKTVLVTGANGYIGSAICRAFARGGWETFGLIRNPAAAAELEISEIIPVIGTFTDLNFLDDLYKRRKTFDAIVSCTEQFPGYAAHFDQVMGLVCALAEKSNENGVRPFVLWTSGCKDYGTTGPHGAPGLSPHIESSPLNTIDALRERMESCVRIFDHSELFDAVLLRPTCVFGYSSSYYGAMFDYARQELEKGARVLTIPANPDNIMHALHVDDCAEAYVTLATHTNRREVESRAFNLSGYRYETTGEVTKALAAAYGFPDGIRFLPQEDADESFPTGLHFVFSFSQWVGSDEIRRVTGWKDKRLLFSENVEVHRRSYERLRLGGHENIAAIQRRIEGGFK
ncbi:hypothetical protein B0T10DRAFT_493700 [Thelonectria olida]|uniref:NAD-dependent epimerase/dehydratase domain-containing protein n=1 Tax=Thelonectria olida TaxID=1576542 RepID=A0A9P8W0W9_9HYPO|nr:hypothetical protein B0T10DRAFT_493700 [Thelonectria olida]